MKKIFAFTMMALIGAILAQAQNGEYQPLVREGVRWINRSYTLVMGDMVVNPYYCAIEICGDTILKADGGESTFKKCYGFKVDRNNVDAPQNFSNKTPNAYLREEDKKVYGIDYFSARWQPVTSTILYDFSDTEQAVLRNLYEEGYVKYFNFIGTENVGGQECRAFEDAASYWSFEKLVESIGLVSHFMGDLTSGRWETLA